MPNFDYEFNQNDYDLIATQNSETLGDFDYIRIIVRPIFDLTTIAENENQEKAVFYASLGNPQSINISPIQDSFQNISINTIQTRFIGGQSNNSKGFNDFIIYKKDNGEVFIKPNEIFNEFELPEDEYQIQIDFLSQLKPIVSDFSQMPFPYYDTEFDITGEGNFDILDVLKWRTEAGRDDIAAFIEDSQLNNYIFPIYTGGGPPDPNAPKNPSDFYNPFSDGSTPLYHFSWIIKEISTTRKEVRLKLVNKNITADDDNIQYIKDILNNETENYQFKHLLSLPNGDNVQILNYQFDSVTDGKNNQSLILKLYEALPLEINNLSPVSIEKEILISQKQNITYFSDVEAPSPRFGLPIDDKDYFINPDGNSNYKTFNQLSQSISDSDINSILSGSSTTSYPNLNVDFNNFSNHVFFSSAKTKLINFNEKIKTIQKNYSLISASLSSNGVDIVNDSEILKKHRKELFNKIDKEINSFTPYERFLYFDGQSESTASAPGLGKNYADVVPVTFSGEAEQINGGDGFNVVYKHSSEKVSGAHNKFIDLFTDKYRVENKPFFNYSSSIYLSFLMKGDSGSAITWENRNLVEHNGLSYPKDTLYQNRMLEPTITASKYQRYIFEASMSYFVPTAEVDFDLSSISNFNLNSPHIEVLSGSIKTGSNQIKDTSGKYPTTVTSQSVGSLFKGSVPPAGELFRIFYQNNLSSSLLAYYDYQGVTIDDNDFEIFDKSGNNNTMEFAGSGTKGFTSASIIDGIQGGDAFAYEIDDSSDGSEGNPTLSTRNSTAPIETAAGELSMSAVAGDAVTGFTMATFYRYDGSGTDNTIMSIGIRTGSLDENNITNGWHLSRRDTNKILGQVTREGVDITGEGANDNGLKSGATTINDGNFHHVAFTYDNLTGTGSVYFDGVLQKEGHSNGLITGSNKIRRLVINTGTGGAHGFDAGAFDETRFYTRALTPSEINQLFLTPDGKTETKITDVKLTLNNPSNVLPFDNIYHTSSAEYTNWYNGILSSASAYDQRNIHSLFNNLPAYIQESNDYDDLNKFLSLKGEQYDLIRNHIDNLESFNKRGYDKYNSPPTNTFPILLDNMGWESINPFTGSLEQTFQNYLSSETTIDDIKNNTWRKTLNNLMYIYKTKGTSNSVRGLLNIYGYPPDVLQFQEFGGSEESSIIDSPPGPIKDSVSNQLDIDFDSITGSFNVNKSKSILNYYMFNGIESRKLPLKWWINDANINTIEFIYKHKQTENTETILKSSGSGAQHLWDLRFIPSANKLSGSFEFRLNNSSLGESNISNRAFSMSLNYSPVSDGELVNVMLQRMTGSAEGVGTGINEYRLHSAIQKGAKITNYGYVTMSISGGVKADPDNQFYANQNWTSTGSIRDIVSSSNLIVGENISGSLAQIKGWSTPLSTSRFRQRVLNKLSNVGNTINSHKEDLIYSFKLDENYTSASVTSSVLTSEQTLPIVDSSPTTNNIYRDYTFTRSGSLFTGSLVYGEQLIDIIKFGPGAGGNKNIIKPNIKYAGNINPDIDVVDEADSDYNFDNIHLEMYSSPQDFVNNFILNHIDTFKLIDFYANPENYYLSNYTDLDNFRNEFFEAYPIQVNVNKFIRAHENIFNNSIVEAVKKIVPARSTMADKDSNLGVLIKPTILERQKYEGEEHSVEVNPNTGTGSINITSVTSVINSLFQDDNLDVKEVEIKGTPSASGLIESPLTASISFGNAYVTSSGYLKDASAKNHFHPPFLQPGGYSASIVLPHSGSISMLPKYDGSAVVFPKTGSINYSSLANKSFENIHSSWGTSSNDTHFINFAAGTGSDGNYNVLHIDTRFHFRMIGDTEIYSSSKRDTTNFSDANKFFNREFINTDFHSSVNYESLINGNVGLQNGRMIGKTRYFSASADGETLTLPANHVTKFSNPFKEQMINGTQNIKPGILNVQYEDYSTASFYRVTVTGGENEIIVKSGNSSLDDEDKIIY